MLIFLLLSLAFSTQIKDIQLVIERAIDLKGPYLLEQSTIMIINDSQFSLKKFQHIVPKQLQDGLFSINAIDFYESDLIMNLVEKNDEFDIYEIELITPIEQNQKQAIIIQQSYIKRMTPYPEYIKQAQTQNCLLYDNVYFTTNYFVQKQTTQYIVQLFLSYTKEQEKHHIKDDVLQYGPYFNTTGVQYKQIKIHFQNTSPMVVFKSVVKTIEISHWGNIAVEIDYHISNDGAKIQGEFNRIDIAHQGSTKSALMKLYEELPYNAWGHSYRDSIGNITTSKVRINKKQQKIAVELKPRFMILGGWQTKFKIGYNLPVIQYLLRKKDSDNFMLTAQFGFDIQTIVAEEYQMNIKLPEYAQNIKYELPFEIDSFNQSKSFSTLDTHGRPTLTFNKKNVFDHHKQDFIVEYSYDSKYHYLKPSLLFISFLSLFSILIIIGRLNFKSLN